MGERIALYRLGNGCTVSLRQGGKGERRRLRVHMGFRGLWAQGLAAWTYWLGLGSGLAGLPSRNALDFLQVAQKRAKPRAEGK